MSFRTSFQHFQISGLISCLTFIIMVFGYIQVRQTIPQQDNYVTFGQQFTIDCADYNTMNQYTFEQAQKVWRLNFTEFYGTGTTRPENNNKQMRFTSFAYQDIGTWECCIKQAQENDYVCYSTPVRLNGAIGNQYTQYPGQVVTQYPGQVITQYPGQQVTQYPGQVITQYPGQVVTQYPGQPVTQFPPGGQIGGNLDPIAAVVLYVANIVVKLFNVQPATSAYPNG